MKLEIGDTAYELQYTVNALADLEQLTDKYIHEIKLSSYVGIRALLWAGLSESMPGLTMKGAGKLLEKYLAGGKTLLSISTIISKAISEAGFLTAQEPKEK